jgi:hypothetical protein
MNKARRLDFCLPNVNRLDFVTYNTAVDIAMGYYFGYPMCCIKFYITRWRPDFQRSRGTADFIYIDQYHKLMNVAYGSSPGYIPCPRCLKARLRRKLGRNKPGRTKVDRMMATLSDFVTDRGAWTRGNPRSSNLGSSKRPG